MFLRRNGSMLVPSCPSNIETRCIILHYIINFGSQYLPSGKTTRVGCPPPLTGTHGFQLAAIKFQVLKPANKHTVEVKLCTAAKFAVCTAGGWSETTVLRVWHLNKKKRTKQKKRQKRGIILRMNFLSAASHFSSFNYLSILRILQKVKNSSELY